MECIVEKLVDMGAAKLFTPIFMLFGCMSREKIYPVTVMAEGCAVAFELIAVILLYIGISQLYGGMCCMHPDPLWVQLNTTVMPTIDADLSPNGLNGLILSSMTQGGFKCDAVMLDLAGAGADTVGFLDGMCRCVTSPAFRSALPRTTHVPHQPVFTTVRVAASSFRFTSTTRRPSASPGCGRTR